MPGQFFIAQRTAEQIKDFGHRRIQVFLLGFMEGAHLAAEEQPNDGIVGDAGDGIVGLFHGLWALGRDSVGTRWYF